MLTVDVGLASRMYTINYESVANWIIVVTCHIRKLGWPVCLFAWMFDGDEYVIKLSICLVLPQN